MTEPANGTDLFQPPTVDVWHVHVPSHVALLEAYERLLDAPERDRCATYRFTTLRQRYAIRHALLRLILAYYVPQEPSQIAFSIGAAGKPFLAVRDGAVEFSLSDSGDRAIVAVTRGRPVGVDIERREYVRPPMEICAQLALSERTAIETSDPAERVETLYRVWVRKEAYLKALGCGLSLPLDAFAVPTDPRPRWTLQSDRQDDQRLWEGCDFYPVDGHGASVVAPSPLGNLRHYSMTPDRAARALTTGWSGVNLLESDSSLVL